jgi:hypothetical protein
MNEQGCGLKSNEGFLKPLSWIFLFSNLWYQKFGKIWQNLVEGIHSKV